MGVVVLVSPRKPGPWGDPSWFGRMNVEGCRGSRLVVQVVKGFGGGRMVRDGISFFGLTVG